MPERDAAVRRCAVPQRFDQEAELLVGLVTADADRLEHPDCISGRWIRMLPPPIS